MFGGYRTNGDPNRNAALSKRHALETRRVSFHNKIGRDVFLKVHFTFGQHCVLPAASCAQ